MKEIKLTRGMVALVDDEDFLALTVYKWCAFKDRKTFYAVRYEHSQGKQTKVYMHRVIMSAPIGMFVDHKDHDGLNNQKSNLRLCNHSQNGRNRQVSRNNTSGFKGVCWNKQAEKWMAYIKDNGISRTLGNFDSREEAAKAYDMAARKLFGEFAKLNFE